MQTVYERIIGLLNQNNISYKTFEHESVRTSEEAAKVRGVDISRGAKSLVFLADGKPLLFVLGGDKRLDVRKVKDTLGIKDLRMATHKQVLELTGVEVGGVPPVGNVVGLPTYIDTLFVEQNEIMDFNAGDRRRSIEMKVKDYLRFVNPEIIELS